MGMDITLYKISKPTKANVKKADTDSSVWLVLQTYANLRKPTQTYAKIHYSGNLRMPQINITKN